MGTIRKILTTGMDAALKGREELIRLLVAEFKRFLNHIDFQTELEKALSRVQLDIQATITLTPKGSGNLRPTLKKIKIKKHS